MCKYEYSDGKCAHPKNLSLDCVGEGNCVYIGDDNAIEEIENALSENMNNNQEHRCQNTQCGIYCEKYNRFYCAGKDNCESKEEYMDHMKTYGGIDIGDSQDRVNY
ncbi:MAG: hypothetical protein R6W73_03090 [Candidatus Saliniplasma sp.]